MGKKKIITDRVATLSAVRRDGSAMHYVSKELKADREVVLASVRRQIKMSTSTKNRLVASAASLFFSHRLLKCVIFCV